MSVFLENFLCSMLETFSYVLCFGLILKVKMKHRRYIFIYSILVIGLQLFFQYCFSGKNINISLLAGALFSVLCRSDKRKENIISFVYVALIESLSYAISVYVLSLMRGYNVSERDGSGLSILCLAIFPICVIVYYIIERFVFHGKIRILLFKEHKITLLISLICSDFVMAIHLLMLSNNHNMQQRMIVSGISFVCVSIIYLVSIIWQGQAIWKNKKLQEEQIMYNYLTKSQQQYLDYIIKRDDDLRKFRHDIRAHMIIMRDMARKEDFCSLLSYIDEVENITQRNQTQHFTGNSTVDAIINDLKNIMDQQNIDFQVKGQMILKSEEKIFDISICVYNVLLNAVEACGKLEIKDRVIRFDIEQYQKKLYLKVSNRCDSERNVEKITELKTDKSDQVNHGLGSKNVQQIVRKNNGKVLYSIKKSWFITEILI